MYSKNLNGGDFTGNIHAPLQRERRTCAGPGADWTATIITLVIKSRWFLTLEIYEASELPGWAERY
jgi:hypothetical protein